MTGFWKFFDKKRNDGHELPPVSDEFKSLVVRLLEYEPDKRLSIAQALKDPWFGLETAASEEVKESIIKRR